MFQDIIVTPGGNLNTYVDTCKPKKLPNMIKVC